VPTMDVTQTPVRRARSFPSTEPTEKRPRLYSRAPARRSLLGELDADDANDVSTHRLSLLDEKRRVALPLVSRQLQFLAHNCAGAPLRASCTVPKVVKAEMGSHDARET